MDKGIIMSQRAKSNYPQKPVDPSLGWVHEGVSGVKRVVEHQAERVLRRQTKECLRAYNIANGYEDENILWDVLLENAGWTESDWE